MYTHGLGHLEKKFAFDSSGLDKFHLDMEAKGLDSRENGKYSMENRVFDHMEEETSKLKDHSPFLSSKTRAMIEGRVPKNYSNPMKVSKQKSRKKNLISDVSEMEEINFQSQD